MRLDRRIRNVVNRLPRCTDRIQRLIGPDEPPGDPCTRCGRHHVLVIEEVVIGTGDDLERIPNVESHP